MKPRLFGDGDETELMTVPRLFSLKQPRWRTTSPVRGELAIRYGVGWGEKEELRVPFGDRSIGFTKSSDNQSNAATVAASVSASLCL